MKKILFIALVATTAFVVSCSNDTETVTPGNTNIQTVKDDFALSAKDDDTINLGDTGGQGGTLPPPPPKRP